MADSREIFRGLKDANGDGEAPDLREEGQAEGDAKSSAILPVIDELGNLQYIPLFKGKIPVTSEVPGNVLFGSGIVAATKGSDIEVAAVTMSGVSKTVDEIFMTLSSTKPVLWKMGLEDNGGLGTEWSVITGSGSFSFSMKLPNLQITGGGVGTQRIVVTGNQLTGSGTDSDLHGFVSAIELI